MPAAAVGDAEATNDVDHFAPQTTSSGPGEPMSLATQSPRRRVDIVARSSELAGGLGSRSELRVLSALALVVSTHVPAARWDSSASQDAGRAAAYGSFMRVDQLSVDRSLFGISVVEARSLDPQQRLVLHVGYDSLSSGGGPGVGSGGPRSLRDELRN